MFCSPGLFLRAIPSPSLLCAPECEHFYTDPHRSIEMYYEKRDLHQLGMRANSRAGKEGKKKEKKSLPYPNLSLLGRCDWAGGPGWQGGGAGLGTPLGGWAG